VQRTVKTSAQEWLPNLRVRAAGAEVMKGNRCEGVVGKGSGEVGVVDGRASENTLGEGLQAIRGY